MAEKMVSPGVFTKENDLSFLQQGVAEIGAAFIGPFLEGPVVPTIVNSQAEFEQLFGAADGTYYTPLAVQNYLREAGTATICRVAGVGGYTETAPLLISALNLGQIDTLVTSSAGLFYSASDGTPNGTAPIYFQGGTFATNPSASVTITNGTISGITISQKGIGLTVAPTTIFVSQSADRLAGNIVTASFDITYDVSGSSAAILFNTLVGSNAGFVGSTLTDNDGNGDFYLDGGLNISASLKLVHSNDVEAVFGTSPFGTKDAYVVGYFKNSGINFDSHASCSVNVLDDQDFTFDAQEALTPMIQSQLIGGARNPLFQFETIGVGNKSNTKVKIGITNVKAAGSVNGTDYGTFTVVVRDFNDTNKKKVVLETFSNVNLDPNSPNYIARVIGDRKLSIDSLGKITENGDWVNNSKYVRVANLNTSAPVQAVPFGHSAYTLPISASAAISSKIPAVSFVTASATQYGGIDLDFNNNDNTIYLKPIPVGAGVGKNVVFALDSVNGGSKSLNDDITPVSERNFIVAFQEGFDGMNPATPINLGTAILPGNTQGLNLTNSTSSGSIAYMKAINALSNADEFDINMVVAPGVNKADHSYVWTAILDMVEQRNDAFFIADAGNAGTSLDATNTIAQGVDSNMAAVYYPWIKTIDINTNKLITVPPSVLLPGVFAANDRVAAEWFAPAGLNRGGLVGAVSVLNRLTQSEKDSLYENKVNPIVQFPGQGIVVFGQKTLQDRPSALDRINVRRLLLTVRKYIASTSRFLVFEQNTSETRNRFLNIVNPYLESIQQRQGLYAFRVVMDDSNNTPDVVDRNIMKGAIFLQPTKTAEFIQIDFNILPTGAAFDA
jgi:phage tail sheath protein FI